MDRKLQVGVIIASVREGRRGESFARWIHELLSERGDIEVELLDLRDFQLADYVHPLPPTKAEYAYVDQRPRRWVATIQALDGFVIVTPEHNHGYPGGLKNAMDHAYAGWNRKPVAFVGYGGVGGVRAIEQLRLVAIELRMVPVRDEVNIRLIGLQTDVRGHPVDRFYAERARAMLDDLTWWTRTTVRGRQVS